LRVVYVALDSVCVVLDMELVVVVELTLRLVAVVGVDVDAVELTLVDVNVLDVELALVELALVELALVVVV
jgi:hypothetical protein